MKKKCNCCKRKAEVIDGICNKCYHTGFSTTGMKRKQGRTTP